MCRLARPRTIVSNGAQPAAGYAAGSVASNSGRRVEVGSGAIADQEMSTCSRCTPQRCSSANVACGFGPSPPPSVNIDSGPATLARSGGGLEAEWLEPPQALTAPVVSATSKAAQSHRHGRRGLV